MIEDELIAIIRHNSGPVLPVDYIGDWNVADYVSTPRKQVPNAVSASTTANLLSAPRRLFANDTLWTKSGITATDDAATAPDGSSEASTLVCTGNWLMPPAFTHSFPAGTYTVAINAKRNTGSDQSFCFTATNTATRSSVFTATSAWQRFSYTFVKAAGWNSNILSLCSIDGSTGANLQVIDAELFAGASDLGPETLSGALVLGGTAYDPQPTVTGEELDLSSVGYGLIQFSAAQTLTEVTTMAVVSKVAAGTVYQATLSKVQAYAELSAMTDLSNTKPYTFLGSGLEYNFAGLWRLLNSGYHTITHVGSATKRQLWIDNMLVFEDSGSMGSVSIRDFWCGLVNSSLSLSTGLKLQRMVMWPTALTEAGIIAANAVFDATLSVARATTTRIYCAEGDSISAADGAYPYLFGPNASPAVIGVNRAVSGSGIAQLNTRAASVDAIVSGRSGVAQDCILSVLIGANDLAGYVGGASAYAADLATYCDARRAAGWQVVVCTILPKDGDATHNARRAVVNADITSTWGGVHCDAIADFAANTTIGEDADAANPTYYSDGVHLTAAGQAIAEPILRAAVNSL